MTGAVGKADVLSHECNEGEDQHVDEEVFKMFVIRSVIGCRN
jgi:hypothetical protein